MDLIERPRGKRHRGRFTTFIFGKGRVGSPSLLVNEAPPARHRGSMCSLTSMVAERPVSSSANPHGARGGPD